MIEMEKTGKDKKSVKIKQKSHKRIHEQVNVEHRGFYDELKVAEIEAIHIEFDNLIEEIRKQGEKFAKNPTLEELKIYKSMIMEFMKYVTNHMYSVEHHTGGTRMRQKIYTVTKIIDEKLNALTQLVLSQQSRNIDLLSTLDEIRGLLIDLYK
jgi:uncharacterized protein YaaR (DUF327 family)